ncbi:MAG: EboA domain-containing protein [Planctomycetota bacterium]
MSDATTLRAETYLTAILSARLDERAGEWLREHCAEIAAGVDGARFASLLSLASRFTPRAPLAPDRDELERARESLDGWNPERWTLLEAVRARLVLARGDLPGKVFADHLEQAFRYADQGELCALYKTLCLLPGPERFTWRAAEGCRTNIVPVFEAIACDNPYPAAHFDDLAWNQMVIKAIFIGAPLWRVQGLDGRLSADLARMALDLADERRSAGRPVQPELWLCLGSHSGERGLASLERELEGSDTLGRRAAALGLARAGQGQRLEQLRESESDPALAESLRRARTECEQTAFRNLDPREA